MIKASIIRVYDDYTVASGSQELLGQDSAPVGIAGAYIGFRCAYTPE